MNRAIADSMANGEALFPRLPPPIISATGSALVQEKIREEIIKLYTFTATCSYNLH